MVKICPILLSADPRLGQIRNGLLNGGFALSCFNLFSHLAHSSPIQNRFVIGHKMGMRNIKAVSSQAGLPQSELEA